jgi:hypothetical protein
MTWMALAVLSACGGSTTTTTDAATPGSDAAATDAATADDAGGTPSCEAYCEASLANCADMEPQYADMASCMGTCAALTPGTLADTSGNTLGCRIYHTSAAPSMPGLSHCIHGGPAGFGVCGESQCEAFCQIAEHACTGANEQWASIGDCMTDCATFAGAVPGVPDGAPSYSTAETGGDSFACRMYHLTVASTDASLAETHCPHIVADSPVCL